MRARRSAYEPVGQGFALSRVVQRRGQLSDGGRDVWVAGIASALLHAALVVVLLLASQGPPPGEPETAPSFAIQFDSGSPQNAETPAAPSPPRVSLGGDDDSPPPAPSPDREAEALPPPLHYGAALRRHTSNNPFAHVVPFDLSPTQPRSLSAGLPGSHSLNLAAGPVVRNGRLMDAVTHVAGAHGFQDYADEIRAFAEAHKYYPRQAADNGEEGVATLEITVDRDGHVKHLNWVGHSGSALLDAAWYSVFADNRLPPMNDDMPGNEYTFTFALDYYLIYGRGRP